MGIFSKKAPAQTSSARPSARIGAGIRLSSDRDGAASATTLEALLASYRTPRYQHLPSHITPGWEWRGPAGDQPDAVVQFEDGNDDITWAFVWSRPSGSEIGLVSLGGDGDLVASQWQALDPSLTRTGSLDAGLAVLLPPPVTQDLYRRTLAAAGFPATPANLTDIGRQSCVMYAIKADELIRRKDPRAADRFGRDHAWQPGTSYVDLGQQIFDDMARWNMGVLPYLQQLPERVRAIILEPSDDGTRAEVFEGLETA